MIHIQGIDHLVLRVIRIDQMLSFDCNALGCTVDRRQDEMGLIQLRAGNSLIDLVPIDGKLGKAGGAAPESDGKNMDHVCLRVELFNEQHIRDLLLQDSIEAGPVESRYGAEGEGPSLYLTDPDGNVVELKGPAT